MERQSITVRGVVQGVGFRPFVHRVASQLRLTGFVKNSAGVVLIEVEGDRRTLDRFLNELQTHPPPLARIDELTLESRPLAHASAHEKCFRIEPSDSVESSSVFIPADVAACDDCLAELFDPADRRYRYPFLNCTNCGPRLTIIHGAPYDRERTTMAGFTMCAACRAEYDDPEDRRFHAQPTACPQCGPRLEALNANGERIETNDPLAAFVDAVLNGGIGAMKGVGGFHLVCDARNERAATELRRRKHRDEKPFAVMVPDANSAAMLCHVDQNERKLLESPQRPIVLLRRAHQPDARVLKLRGKLGDCVMVARSVSEDECCVDIRPRLRVGLPCVCDVEFGPAQLQNAPARAIASQPPPSLARRAGVADSVAPGNPYLGVMLPYTPLHHLLMQAVAGIPLVMTSGNRADEPIAYQNEDAVERLGGIADVYLTHNRPIHIRCDDSVTRIVDGEESPVRRSRGYAPQPIRLPFECPRPILAVGGQFKGVFALGRDLQAFLSHHLGDLDHFDAYRAFERDVGLYEELFDVHPEIIVHDLHPDYATTGYAAKRRKSPTPGTQPPALRQQAVGLGLRAASPRSAPRHPTPVTQHQTPSTQHPAPGTRRSTLAVQHHHAHMASCMAENGLDEPVIGVTFDGTGFGTDGAIWGGEFLVGDYTQFTRAAHLRYVRMPGGDKAVREPWRIGVAHLLDAGCDPATPARSASEGGAMPNVVASLARRAGVSGPELRTIEQMIARGFNSPFTSSAGRLFDAVAAIAGVRTHTSYEGQAAMELEWLATEVDDDGAYPFDFATPDPHNPHQPAAQARDASVPQMIQSPANAPDVVDTRPLIRAVVEDVRRGVRPALIARRFHTTVVEIIAAVCRCIRSRIELNAAVLSGGVFMNALLAREVYARLKSDGFRVHRHHLVPPGDGGLSLGQLAIAAKSLA